MQWKTTWGAIALDKSIMGESISAGKSVGADSKRLAEKEALSQCKSDGGKKCEIVVSYHNQCVAFVDGNGRYSVSNAATIELASKNAMATCEMVTDNCEVIYTECTEAYQR